MSSILEEVLAPEACETMADVRAGIDALDHELVHMLAQRQRYIDAAGRIKPSRDKVRDEPRINQVLENVLRHAQAAGLDWSIAEPVWRTLIERSIAHEFEVFDQRSVKG